MFGSILPVAPVAGAIGAEIALDLSTAGTGRG